MGSSAVEEQSPHALSTRAEFARSLTLARRRARLSVREVAGVGALWTVAASPVDGTIVAGGADRRIFSWDTDPDAVSDRTCRLAGAAITSDEWSRYVPAQEFAAPCVGRE